MHIAYMDESGNDGFPAYSSELFALSVTYLPCAQWWATFDRVKEFRRELRDEFGLPVKTALHTKYLLLGGKPYRALGLAEPARIAIMEPRLTRQRVSVLDRALTFSVQRVENDLRAKGGTAPGFLLVTDEGRVAAIRGTTRRLQRSNYIPPEFGGDPYRLDIETMIEYPLPKNSRESYFVHHARHPLGEHRTLPCGVSRLERSSPNVGRAC